MSEWTKEPWRTEDENYTPRIVVWRDMGFEPKRVCYVSTGATFKDFDRDESLANMNRIVACVNACAGIPTDQIAGLVGENKRLRELLTDAEHELGLCQDEQSVVEDVERWTDLQSLRDRIKKAQAALAGGENGVNI